VSPPAEGTSLPEAGLDDRDPALDPWGPRFRGPAIFSRALAPRPDAKIGVHNVSARLLSMENSMTRASRMARRARAKRAVGFSVEGRGKEARARASAQ